MELSKDLVIPISMDITQSEETAELIESIREGIDNLISGDGDSFLDQATQMVNAPLVPGIDWFKVWILMGLLMIVFGALLWDVSWAKDEKSNWVFIDRRYQRTMYILSLWYRCQW